MIERQREPIYRYAQPADARALGSFATHTFVEAYRDQCPLADLQAHAARNFTAEKLTSEIAAESSRMLIAQDGEALAGYALLTLESAPACPLRALKPAQIERIYVAPVWQGRGVGRELLGRCMAAARAAGCDVVWLAVWDANARAMRFYLKSGFQIVGEQPFVLGDDVQRDFVMAWPAS